MRKINSINFGPQWIFLSLLVGGIIPGVVWAIFQKVLWWMIGIGGVSLLVFIFIFSIEMKQDFGKVPYYQKKLRETIPFDPDTQYPVIKSSICTGEKMAGFKNRTDGKFTEVMLIRNDDDKRQFMYIYGLEEVTTEY